MRSMYEYSCGSIPERGNILGKNYIERVIRNDINNTQYIAKLDIKKFFKNINHDILKTKLSRIIKDDRFLNILFIIIDNYEEGLPLGFYTSQWLANFYLQDLDHFIKNILGTKYYIRYMDDMVLFGQTSKECHFYIDCIINYCDTNLNLKIKENWQVFKFADTKKDNARCLDFMGYKFYREYTIIRKNILLKTTRKVNKIIKKNKYTYYDAIQLLSFYGWIKHSDTYNALYKTYFLDNKIYIKDLKHKVSEHQKYLNQKGENHDFSTSENSYNWCT